MIIFFWRKLFQILEDIQRKEVIIMGALEDLQAKVQALKDLVATINTSVTGEIARVEAIILNLQTGSVSAADVEKAATDLQGVVDNLKTVGTTLDAERP